MEKLKEAYMKLNAKVEIEVQLTDSTSGMNSVMEGVCDIGMASRELKDSEKEKLDSYVIAMDGIAVIVNKGNSIDELSSDQVKKIFIGDITSWDDVK
jgi:phosphate transport system substrate-binding protein